MAATALGALAPLVISLRAGGRLAVSACRPARGAVVGGPIVGRTIGRRPRGELRLLRGVPMFAPLAAHGARAARARSWPIRVARQRGDPGGPARRPILPDRARASSSCLIGGRARQCDRGRGRVRRDRAAQRRAADGDGPGARLTSSCSCSTEHRSSRPWPASRAAGPPPRRWSRIDWRPTDARPEVPRPEAASLTGRRAAVSSGRGLRRDRSSTSSATRRSCGSRASPATSVRWTASR